MFALHSALDAVLVTTDVQQKLAYCDWPPELLALPKCRVSSR